MKRVMCLLLSLCLVLALTGCMSGEERQARKEALEALSGGGRYALSTGTTLENQPLYSDRNIIVQLAGLTGTPDAPQLKLAVRNGTRKELNFSVDSLVINGWQVDGWLDLYDVPPHTVTMGTLECGSDLSLCHITDVASVELSLEIYDGNYDTVAAVSSYVETSCAGPAEDYTPEGITLLEEEGLLVRAVGLNSGSSGTTLSLFVSNDTNRTVTLSATQARWNGEPVELWFYDQVAPACKRMLSEWVYTEDSYEDIQMADGDQLSFRLDIEDWDTGIVLQSTSVTLSPDQF